MSDNDAAILTGKSNLLKENHYHDFKFLANLCRSLESVAYRKKKKKSINKVSETLRSTTCIPSSTL